MGCTVEPYHRLCAPLMSEDTSALEAMGHYLGLRLGRLEACFSVVACACGYYRSSEALVQSPGVMLMTISNTDGFLSPTAMSPSRALGHIVSLSQVDLATQILVAI